MATDPNLLHRASQRTKPNLPGWSRLAAIQDGAPGVDLSVDYGAIRSRSNGGSQDTEVLYREHGPAVARLCRSLLRDNGEAEDAAQQVFLSAHRALLNGSAPRDPLAWLL